MLESHVLFHSTYSRLQSAKKKKLIHIPCASQLRICSLSNAGHPQQVLDKRETPAKPKTTSLIRAVLQQRSPEASAERRQKWDFSLPGSSLQCYKEIQQGGSQPWLGAGVPEPAQPCPYPAAVRGHAAGAERRGARHGNPDSAASAPCMACSNSCTAAAQGKRAASAWETGGGKGLMLWAKQGGSRKVQC